MNEYKMRPQHALKSATDQLMGSFTVRNPDRQVPTGEMASCAVNNRKQRERLIHIKRVAVGNEWTKVNIQQQQSHNNKNKHHTLRRARDSLNREKREANLHLVVDLRLSREEGMDRNIALGSRAIGDVRLVRCWHCSITMSSAVDANNPIQSFISRILLRQSAD